MTVTYGFYNSQNGDRKYNAEQMGSIFDGVINDGIYQSIGDHFAVSPDSGDVVLVGSGRAWFNHTWTLNDASLPIECEPSDILLNRYDAIILEVNSTDSVRANTIKAVKGTPGSNPSYPTLINTETVHQYPLAYIYRAAGSASITAANIRNVIGTSSTPFVTGILQVTSVDEIYRQWEDQWNQWFAVTSAAGTNEMEAWMNDQQLAFNTWFGNLQIILDGDVATRLALAIQDLQEFQDILTRTQTSWQVIEDSEGNAIQDSYDSDIIGRIVFAVVE